MDRRDLLIESGLALASERSLDALLQRIVDLSVDITGARYGALGVLDNDRRISRFVTAGISAEVREAIGDPPVGRGVLGLLIRDAQPIRLPDITAHPASVGFPPNHPIMHSFLGAPLLARGRVFGNIYLADKQGAGGFDADDEFALTVLAAQAGVALDNARLHEETRERARWLAAAHEVGARILTGAGAEEALELVAQHARALARADLAIIATPLPDERQLKIAVAVGAHAAELQGTVFPLEGSISGEVIRTARPVAQTDASADPNAYQPIVQLGDMGPALLVPLAARGRAFGTLAVANLRGGRTFDDDDRALVETFAAQAAVALEFERAQRETQRLLVLEDRERIAKELHDGVIQSLFAVGMGLQGTAAVDIDPEQADRIEGAVAEIDRVIRDLRNYIFGLRPGILADRQLDQALRHLADEFQQKSGVVTVVEVDETVASELASSAADIVQLTREALSNVGRHAGASTCRVSLGRNGQGAAVLVVDDDGKGFDLSRVKKGQGLPNLQARARSLGGAAEIESTRSEGTTVRITIPL